MASLVPGSTLVGEVDEPELLRRILLRLASPPPHVGGMRAVVDTLIGPGDDAALLRLPDGHAFISTDTLVEGYDFRRLWPCGYATTGYDVGWKAVAQNVADISAMGGFAAALTVSLSIPGNLEVSWVESFADGVNGALKFFSGQTGRAITVVGGDLGAADRISVTVTVVGVPANVGGAGDGAAPVAVRRSGARVGDIIAVSRGDFPLGAAHVALGYLEAKGGKTDSKLFRPQLRPSPDFSVIVDAVDARAMIDVSDGLVHEVGMLVEASSQRSGTVLRARLDDKALVELAEDLRREMYCDFDAAMTAVLSGGEDHLLVACFAAGVEVPGALTPIGTIIRGTEDGSEATFPIISDYLPYTTIFDHFSPYRVSS